MLMCSKDAARIMQVQKYDILRVFLKEVALWI